MSQLQEGSFLVGGRFSSSFVNFLVKIRLWIDLFSVLDRKRTKLSPELISLRILGIFVCRQSKKRGLGALRSQPRVEFGCPPFFDWGAVFGNVSIFSVSNLFCEFVC